MDMLQVGNTVTIKVKNLLWPVRDRYMNDVAGPELHEYTGTVMREKWFNDNEVGLTTGIAHFPFRRINKEHIVEVNGASVQFTANPADKKVTMTVQGSKGNTYIVTKEGNKKSCTCPGFGFRRTCKHLDLVA